MCAMLTSDTRNGQLSAGNVCRHTWGASVIEKRRWKSWETYFLFFWLISVLAASLLVLRVLPERTSTIFLVAFVSSLITTLFAGVMASAVLCALAAIWLLGIVLSMDSQVPYFSRIMLYSSITFYYGSMMLAGAFTSGSLSSKL